MTNTLQAEIAYGNAIKNCTEISIEDRIDGDGIGSAILK